MDLLERDPQNPHRHPWELARAQAVEDILSAHMTEPPRAILDLGCGDGYTGKRVRAALGADALTGLDAFLDADQAAAMTTAHERYVQREADVEGRFALLLMLDVIEHVADDIDFIRRAVANHATPESAILITVPAFQALFSGHDRALKHYRRYTLAQLQETTRDAGLETVASGYLFSSLLAPRALTVLRERAMRAIRRGPAHGSDGGAGAGAWRQPAPVTAAIKTTLALVNALLLWLARRGFQLPGLSAWTFCKPRKL